MQCFVAPIFQKSIVLDVFTEGSSHEQVLVEEQQACTLSTLQSFSKVYRFAGNLRGEDSFGEVTRALPQLLTFTAVDYHQQRIASGMQYGHRISRQQVDDAGQGMPSGFAQQLVTLANGIHRMTCGYVNRKSCSIIA